jgi:hypothetical protein
MNPSLTLIIIGGGAAGFFGAITAKLTNPAAKVTLLEALKTPLTKVRISGGGRCNVTHHCFEVTQLVQAYPRGNKALRGAFSRFQSQDTIAWFASRGVKLKTEADGRMFPTSDDSTTIVDCLLNTAQEVGVNLQTEARVKTVEKENNRFLVTLKSGEILSSDRLLIATGSHPSGYQWAKHLGHSIISPVPSLFTFTIKDRRLQGLEGISVEDVELTLLNAGKKELKQRGALLITHWGLSGPVVLKLSAWGARILHDCNYRIPLKINWLPQQNPDHLRQHLLKVKEQSSKKQISSFSPVNLPKRLWQSLIQSVGINLKVNWSDLSKKQLNLLLQELLNGKYQIVGKGVFKEEFVTCGGVHLKEIDFKTMESKICSGLFFAGEILDIDGITGGFNFQNAWTTGWLAGKGMNYEL